MQAAVVLLVHPQAEQQELAVLVQVAFQLVVLAQQILVQVVAVLIMVVVLTEQAEMVEVA
jgi:hypothetical protein